MIPTYLTSPSPFPNEFNEDQPRQISSPNSQVASYSSLSSHIFFNSTQDQSGYFHKELQDQLKADMFTSHEGSYDLENENNSLKTSEWKKEDRNENHNPVKWMSSKMRLMRKMKNWDGIGVEITAYPTTKLEDQKQPSSPLETENSSNSSSNNSNNPIRVCSDCNTTKTPLWRSGPRGPKSLCNACGIRQRKARRAMAAAAANGTALTVEASSMKTKLQRKEKIRNNGYVAQYKKRRKLATGSSHEEKKLCFEDFFINLSNNLAFHRVFPQDEKEAAILLMALSCGLVHG